MEEFDRQGKGTPVAIIAFAFNLAVQRRFGSRRDLSEIIRFVADARAFLSEGRDLPAKEAEHLICATLDIEVPGVEETVENLDLGTVAEIEGQLLFKLIADEQMSQEQLNEFLMKAERLANEWQPQA
ncbi:hypothetical protein [Micromonospora pisi]|nr:hypothetical protein [Micromonospora pisi]